MLSVPATILCLVSCDTPQKPAPFSVSVPDAQGLKAGAPVRIAGVDVGTVNAVTLDGDQARIQFRLDDGVGLRSDACASIASRNLNGDMVLKLRAGSAVDSMPPGRELTCVTSGGADAITESMSQLVADTLAGKGVIGRLLRDDGLAAKLDEFLSCERR